MIGPFSELVHALNCRNGRAKQISMLRGKKSPHSKFEVHNKNPDNAQQIDPHGESSKLDSKRIVLNLESEVMRGPGSIPRVTFCHWIFSCSKTSDANIGIIANFVYLWKTKSSSSLWTNLIFKHCKEYQL